MILIDDIVEVVLVPPRARGVGPEAGPEAGPEVDPDVALSWTAAEGRTAVVRELLALSLDRSVDPRADDDETQEAYYGHTAVVRGPAGDTSP